ncbi:MAG: acyl-CoA dehydrogenase [Acidimicrobiaceae bacterium]|nr:acyl-CoA dehydrogenase [Acidimicrobiaceae bacterium]
MSSLSTTDADQVAQDRWASAAEVHAAFADWVNDQAWLLEPPGQGATWKRWTALAEVARSDLAFARLVEGHADATAILAEAGQRPRTPGPYGVWASQGSGPRVTAERTPTGWRFEGQKAFCSGAGMLERALVTAEAPDGPRLFDLDVRGVEVVPGSWPAVGMSRADSPTVTFAGVASSRDEVGPPGFYTRRIGFWWGAAGVAACWWGGARGLVETLGLALRHGHPDDHQLAAFGTAVCRIRGMQEGLRWAAGRIDERPDDLGEARRVACIVREIVHDGCSDVLGRAASAGGARPICLDPAQSRRSADLYAYLAQHHGGRDAAAVGRELLDLPG